MPLSLQVTFRDMQPSPAVEARIRECGEKLLRINDNIHRCHVVVEAPHQRHTKGAVFHIHVDISLPGAELVVSREPELNPEHEDVYLALRDAFKAVRRQLENYSQQRRAGQAKKRRSLFWGDMSPA